ncbi:UNVERIFIED_CONTAM: parvulin-like peptidyl-prolyl cis-trans isomerase protein [Acetivibrio alkalicellulosi]
MKSFRCIMFILSCTMVFNLYGCSLFGGDSNSQKDNGNYVNEDGYVAKVEGQKITIPEFRYLLSYVMSGMEDNAGLSEGTFIDKIGYWQRIEENQEEDNETIAKKEALKRLKEMKIINIKAKEQNIVLDEDDIAEVKNYTQHYIDNVADGNREVAEGIMLDELGMNFREFEALNGELVLTRKFREKLMQEMEISDDELLELYESKTEIYDAVLIEYILILTETYPWEDPLKDDEIEEKRILAQEILQMAIGGRDFDALTEEYTEDPDFDLYGNQYAFVVADAAGEVDLWAASSQEGDFNMFEVPAGFLIVKTTKKFGFEDAREIIKKDIRLSRYIEQLEVWMKDDKYEIEINQPVFDSMGVQ